MKQSVGRVLTVLGLIGTIYFGIEAIQNSESFSFLGLDVSVSSANWTPLIISVTVLALGLIVSRK